MQQDTGMVVVLIARLAAFVLFFTVQVPASAQLVGHFHAAAEQHLVGAPVFLIFEVTNTGARSLVIQEANPLTPCAGYLFRIDGENRADGTCDGLAGYSCVVGSIELAPGKTTSQKVLLNHYYEISHSGRYHVHAMRRMRWWLAGQDKFNQPQQQQVFEDEIELDLKAASPAELRAAFDPYMKALASKDEDTHAQALQTLMLLAPAFLETTFIKMLDSEDWGQALVGLRHLNSVPARDALSKIAEFGVTVKPDADDLERMERSSEQGLAIKYLAEMGDPTYFPLVLNATQQAPLETQTRIYGTWAVGQLGGEDALPFLLSESHASTKGQRIQGAVAIGFTASRKAVPILIELLQSPEEDIRQVAENGLEMLTHRAATEGDISSVEPKSLYRTWRNWWGLNNASAQIYDGHACGDKLLIN
jgi:hypothetical protein